MRLTISHFLLAIAGISLVLHIYLLPRLNIIEDESAYMQDAAQITSTFLPFRDFGGTKGPFWLFIFHGWQEVFGQSLLATRLFSSLAHIGSIYIFWYFLRSFDLTIRTSAIATTLWALSAVVVSLTTNITHIPLELCFILGGFLCLRQSRLNYAYLAGILLFCSLLMRATAIAFVPAALMLIFMRKDRWKVLWRISLAFLLSLALTVAIIYPLYGWPKTAFFFNADATLIANKQRAVYTKTEAVSPLKMLYDAALPLRRDGLSILFPAILLPVILLVQWYRGMRIPKSLLILLCAWVGSFILFYKGWGRSPTPFYPLESIPALAIAAALSIDALLMLGKRLRVERVFMGIIAFLFILDLVSSFRDIPINQYRGTVEVQAAEKVAAILKERVRPGEAIFTAQPVFPYLAELPLYGGYTHPGWYLSERAGYLPSAIRGVFYPDFETLAGSVAQDVTWIVLDWRTNDVYFNEGSAATKDLRSLLARDFEEIATVSNPSSRDIRIYRKVTE